MRPCSDREIEGGTVVITVYFHNIPVHSERDDLCSKTACPIQPGEFVLKNSEVLPGYTPPVSCPRVGWNSDVMSKMPGFSTAGNLLVMQGAYKIKLQIVDDEGSVLACAYVNFDIVWNWLAEEEGNVKLDLPSILQHNANEKPMTLADK